MSLVLQKKLFIVLILLSSCIGYAQWYPQNTNTTSFLNSVFFINQTTGWACGFERVLKTTNCGNTWINSFLLGNHRSIYFTDEDNGFICGDNGRLYKTINGGQNWMSVSSGVTVTLNQITFLNENFGLIAGNNNTILKSTDFGVNWYNTVNIKSSLNFLSAKILTNNIIFASGSSSSVYKSTSSGNFWDTLSFGVPNPFLTIEFINENTGWVSGCCGMFLKTTDAGINWSSEVYLTPGFSIYSMKFLNDNFGWVAGEAGYIFRTTNGGNTWDSLISNTYFDLHSIAMINKDTGFAVGYNGLVLRTTNGGGPGFPVGIEHISSETPEGFYLFQNFPNPFNPKTTINYQLPASGGEPMFSYVQLKIYNVLGNEVAVLVNEKQPPGNYSVKFDGTDFSSGLYFYHIVIHSDKIQAGKFEQVKKMILIK